MSGQTLGIRFRLPWDGSAMSACSSFWPNMKGELSGKGRADTRLGTGAPCTPNFTTQSSPQNLPGAPDRRGRDVPSALGGKGMGDRREAEEGTMSRLWREPLPTHKVYMSGQTGSIGDVLGVWTDTCCCRFSVWTDTLCDQL